MTELNNFIATRLLNFKAIKLQPNNLFEWGNGWTSPIYFDSRKLLSYPQVRCLFKLEIARLAVEKFPEVEAIAAVAPNSIALGILVAEELGLPFVYVHPQPKDHGLENRIEGELKPRQKVVIIEDQVSFANNCVKVQDALEKDGSIVLGMVTIFNFQLEEGTKNLEEAHLACHALTNFNTILSIAPELCKLTDEDIAKLQDWHANPTSWKKAPQKRGRK